MISSAHVTCLKAAPAAIGALCDCAFAAGDFTAAAKAERIKALRLLLARRFPTRFPSTELAAILDEIDSRPPDARAILRRNVYRSLIRATAAFWLHVLNQAAEPPA